MSNRKIKILVVSSVVLGLLMGGVTFFWKVKNSSKKTLIISRDHPATTNISFEDCQFYQITGVENIPLVPSEGEQPYKIVKFSDQITIPTLQTI